MNELKIFNNEEFGKIRTVTIDNEPWFVGKDVATALGYAKPENAISSHVSKEDKTSTLIQGSGSNYKSKAIIINESGLYALIFGSKLESAKEFKHWVTSEVLPTLRKTGSYEMPKTKQRNERLASVNNAVKILTPMLQAAGCNSKIQLLTAKSLYEKAGVNLPITIEADQQYVDTVHIARQARLYYKSSGKPADKAVNEIIRRLDLSEDMYTETWESKGKWQGTVRKYAPEVISMVKQWYADNGYPREISYTQCDGQTKKYHVIVRDSDAA
ncbi:MAG: Bro-N domain-containing protein [Lachnospiraceae bacterium]|nr:Bro-N domain-containing protein [Lachnospiraceae bacterium]